MVVYGGLSLAVYMHGIIKELQKLVRASKVLQMGLRAGGNRRAGYDAFNDDPKRETDSERIYFALLSEIGEHIDLRVVIDVISGTSAGGINAIMLARALAHDLPLDGQRELWLKSSDAEQLMDREALPSRWSKAYVRPLLWGLRRAGANFAPEIEDNLSRLVRGRWWNPPFSGPNFFDQVLTGLDAMGPSTPYHSLVPFGHPLSLFVTLTDLNGFPRQVTLHDPEHITERIHRRNIEFSYIATAKGVTSDFDSAGLPGLAFTARATSSYGGLFPPMTLDEATEALRKRGTAWPEQNSFFADKLGMDAQQFSGWPFIDGGVLNNKPFRMAISAIQSRPADRQVVRRLLFIEPNPESPDIDPPETLSYLGLIKRAMVDLPAAQPIGEELKRLDAINKELQMTARLIARMRPQVDALITDSLGDALNCIASSHSLHALRMTADTAGIKAAGFAYQSYLMSRYAAFVQQLGIAQADLPGPLPAHQQTRLEEYLLARFDLNYRLRRCRFVVRRVNEQYGRSYASRGLNSALNEAKAALYRLIHHPPSSQSSAETITRAAHDFVSSRASEHTEKNEEVDKPFDATVLKLMHGSLPGRVSRELLLAYLGFTSFDILTWPHTRTSDITEVEEMKVVRLSPNDAESLRAGKDTLKSTQLDHFSGFFSRAFRENDYLWGRLHGAERVVDLVLDAARQGSSYPLDGQAFKRRLFESIVAAEAPYLTTIEDEIDHIRREISKISC